MAWPIPPRLVLVLPPFDIISMIRETHLSHLYRSVLQKSQGEVKHQEAGQDLGEEQDGEDYADDVLSLSGNDGFVDG